jgi:hypothetical protein
MSESIEGPILEVDRFDRGGSSKPRESIQQIEDDHRSMILENCSTSHGCDGRIKRESPLMWDSPSLHSSSRQTYSILESAMFGAST